MSILYILAAILMLGIMVMVHEAGHFFAARLTGIPVKEFAIGFGPKLLSWNSKKHETKFFVRLIPMGGYCMFYGEDDTEEKEKDDERNLNNFSVWKRLVTILMGPVMNFVLALVVAVGFCLAIGVENGSEYGYSVVLEVNENSPAQEAGLQVNDVILAVNGQDAYGVDAENVALFSRAVRAFEVGNEPLKITVRREFRKMDVVLSPQWNEAEGAMQAGIIYGIQQIAQYRSVGFGEAIGCGVKMCVDNAKLILEFLGKLFTDKGVIQQSSGPLGIIQGVAMQVEDYGWVTYLQLLIFISVNLGLFNLLPIPGLDGSRLIFLAIEGIFRKPVPRKIEAYIHMGGYLLLIGFMVFVTFQDVGRMF